MTNTTDTLYSNIESIKQITLVMLLDQLKIDSVFVFRQNAIGGSSEEFDSESSILVTKRPTRRSRSYTRQSRASDSSTSAGAKKTTFFTEEAPDSTERQQNGSIKSSSSYDVSKISFQGKRALFETGGPVPALTKSVENLSLPSMVQESNLINLDARNRQLEQEIARLEQAAALREEMSKRLREKVDKLELDLKERGRYQQKDISLIQKDNREKENLIL